jgi:CcmD family protein
MNPPSEWQYVAAAYLVVFVAVVAWVAIIGSKLQRLQRQIGDLVDQLRERSVNG